MKNRQDAWLEEQDILLADTVLKHVKEGSTQLKAFEETGDALNRTASACGFRWNSVVRHRYIKALESAKKQRKQHSPFNRDVHTEVQKQPLSLSKTKITVSHPPDSKTITMIDVLNYLTIFISLNEPELLKKENDRLRSELKTVTQERDKFKEQLEQHKQTSLSMQEDYESVMKIMDRARKFVSFAEEKKPVHATFKMDRNGNLEKIAD